MSWFWPGSDVGGLWPRHCAVRYLLRHCQHKEKGLLTKKGDPFLVRGVFGRQRVCPLMIFIVPGLVSILHINHPLFVHFSY